MEFEICRCCKVEPAEAVEEDYRECRRCHRSKQRARLTHLFRILCHMESTICKDGYYSVGRRTLEWAIKELEDTIDIRRNATLVRNEEYAA